MLVHLIVDFILRMLNIERELFHDEGRMAGHQSQR